MFSPFIKNAVVTADGQTFSDEVSNVRWTHAPTTNTFIPVSGKTVSDTTAGAWTLAFNYGEDWEKADSLANYLYDNEGKTVPLTFQSKGDGSVVFTSNVTLALVGVGGTAGVAETQATFGSDRPVRGTITEQAGG